MSNNNNVKTQQWVVANPTATVSDFAKYLKDSGLKLNVVKK